MTWHAQAACLGADAETFFPARGDVAGVKAALAVCATCPAHVVEACLDENLDKKDGIYGGTTGADRRKLRAVRTVNRDCLHCGTGFKRVGQAQFCSEECRQQRRYELQKQSALWNGLGS
jgi:hypothetical protein